MYVLSLYLLRTIYACARKIRRVSFDVVLTSFVLAKEIFRRRHTSHPHQFQSNKCVKMLVIATKQGLAIVLMLLLSLTRISDSETSFVPAAFVRTLKPTYTHTHGQRHVLHQLLRLGLETSPLIGGPSWLPLHVKVVLQNKELYHQWDLIPIDATNTTTLQNLVTLQHVPAQIRHRIFAMRISQNDIASSSLQQQELLHTNIYSADTLEEFSDNEHMSRDFTAESKQKIDSMNLDMNDIDKDQLYIELAHHFCQSFAVRTNMELHLVWNNCWTFALQLVIYLLIRSYQGTSSDSYMR